MDKAAPGAGKASCKGCVCGLKAGGFFPKIVFVLFLLSAALAQGFPLCSTSRIKQELRREAQGGWCEQHFPLWNSHFIPSPQIPSLKPGAPLLPSFGFGQTEDFSYSS